MGKSKKTSSQSMLETLAAELWVKEVKEVVQSKYADGNGVAMVGEDHRRKESQFQVIVSKAKIEELQMKNGDEERDESNISELAKSKTITFFKEDASNENPGNRCVKDHLRAVTAGIDPNYRDKSIAGLWSGEFGDQEKCDEESLEFYPVMCTEKRDYIVGKRQHVALSWKM